MSQESFAEYYEEEEDSCPSDEDDDDVACGQEQTEQQPYFDREVESRVETCAPDDIDEEDSDLF